MAEIALSLPFSVSPYGTISSTSDQSKIWSDRVRFVIGTNLQERLLDVQFGTLVPSTFMDTQDDARAEITSEVERAFALQLTLLRLNSVEVSFDDTTGTSNVSINYSLPNNEVAITAVAIAYLSGTNTLVQENL